MAPRRFPQFARLPPELRVRIWRLLMLPQIIRAQWETVAFNETHISIYWLFVGVMPITLRVCEESRQEAKKHYSLIRSRVPLRSEPTEERDGERKPPASSVAQKTSKKNEKDKSHMQKLWVNFNTDSCYFVNMPPGYEFNTWYNRVHKPRISGLAVDNPIRHIAIEGEAAQRLRNSGRTDIFYLMCMRHPQLESITIMLDNSQFSYDKKPADYAFRDLKETDENDRRTGGKYANAEVREQIAKIFAGFWEGKPNIKNCDKWKDWRLKNPSWKEPEVTMKGISKTPRETKKQIREKEEAERLAIEKNTPKKYKAKKVVVTPRKAPPPPPLTLIPRVR
ncbi:hypothetical protein LZ554_009338 [Drepanopeziza brunnea f. sp. 'monogermtubi']|nr:hypothetical protein LZ554_009338 [Drepanopeziza brunnea f. sp. 'monogermtubi']